MSREKSLHPTSIVSQSQFLQHRQRQRDVSPKHIPALAAQILERKRRRAAGNSLVAIVDKK